MLGSYVIILDDRLPVPERLGLEKSGAVEASG